MEPKRCPARSLPSRRPLKIDRASVYRVLEDPGGAPRHGTIDRGMAHHRVRETKKAPASPGLLEHEPVEGVGDGVPDFALSNP
jgi:hypothetical protein